MMTFRPVLIPVRWLPPLLLLLGLAGRAAALMAPLSTTNLVAMSDAIVEGRITGVVSRYTDDHSAIVTEVTVEPSDVLLGEPGPVTFLVEGGRVDDMEQWVSDMPAIESGKSVLVFLRAQAPVEKSREITKSHARAYALAGAAQGLHHIRGGQAVKGGFSVLGDARVVDASLPLEDLKDRIRRQLENQRRERGQP